MKLELIQDTVVSIAEAIANVLDIDVIIVDHECNIIGNTYKHMVSSEIIVDEKSVVGQVIATGKAASYIDINQSLQCRECQYLNDCIIQGMIAVPIYYENVVIGSIGTIIKDKNVQERIKLNIDGIVSFLEKMADLISSKLKNIEDYKKIELINKEKELIIETITDGIAFIDNEGKIIYSNNVFKEYFNVDSSIINKKITDIVPHNVIERFLYNRKNIFNKIITIDKYNVEFKGLITCVNTKVNDDVFGTLIILKKIEVAYKVINELSNNKSLATFDEIICKDETIKNIIREAKKIAITDNNILIKGEIGTGKKMFANAIHNFSSRKDNYFFVLNCNEISRDNYLLELFGISKNGKNIGKFQLANNGTIVFDEICELPLNIQNDLLNYLNTGQIELEKGVIVKDIDVRIIATTSKNIEKLALNREFNEELFYRLNSTNISIPPLKDRSREDFDMLVKHYINVFINLLNKKDIEINEDGLEILFKYQWKSNIKELKKIIERIVYQTNENIISETLIKKTLNIFSRNKKTVKIKKFDEYEKEILENALMQYEDSKNGKYIVAEKLDIGIATLYRKIKKYNL
ncbi:sigma 54-interacting transcriptional regulator [Abyssisolibacter fermentans]|uniref:sigma 54-interacting transcriptional regulator n=1 Tax=Abyssisolibacter fermentans TaxID=1766203 RepID=UPI0008319C28|nr:sigma 54-interacting transcriptional regulator [Abyssisolibacter fermentans]